MVEVSDDLGRWVPERYAHFPGIETLTCTPVSAGGRWLGVIFADRGGGRFELTDAERHAMWTLGKTAALAASVRIATSQQGRARLLQARIDLAREIHERVVQRLFGVSLVLGSEQRAQRGGAAALRRRDAGGAEGPARRARAAARAAQPRHRRDAARGARAARPPLQGPAARARLGGRRRGARRTIEPLAQSVLAEALRNADKHAAPVERARARRAAWTAPSCSRSATTAPAADTRGTGMGLRLAAVEALGRGGWSSSGRRATEWRVRLVVPLDEGDQ